MASARCIFCELDSRSDPSVVFEDEHTLALLDHRPLFAGHCLLIPRQHYETFADLPPDAMMRLMTAGQLLYRAVEQAMHADGIFMAMNNRVSQSIPHLHLHIVPRHHKDGLKGFFWPRSRYKDEAEMVAVRDAIREAMEEIVAGNPRDEIAASS